MHNVPGRKTDLSDADWIGRLIRFGMVRANFVPGRRSVSCGIVDALSQHADRGTLRETQRLDKVLQDAGVKITSVASKILWMSQLGLMIEALIAGTTDPQVLADLAIGKMRAKITAVAGGVGRRNGAVHATVDGEIIAHMDYADETIERLQTADRSADRPFR